MEGEILSNKAGVALKTANGYKIPPAGETGTIQTTGSWREQFLTVNNTTSGSADFQDVFDDSDNRQQWERSADDNEGYFTLTSSISGKLLTAIPENNRPGMGNILLVEGIYSLFFPGSCLFTMYVVFFYL